MSHRFRNTLLPLFTPFAAASSTPAATAGAIVPFIPPFLPPFAPTVVFAPALDAGAATLIPALSMLLVLVVDVEFFTMVVPVLALLALLTVLALLALSSMVAGFRPRGALPACDAGGGGGGAMDLGARLDVVVVVVVVAGFGLLFRGLVGRVVCPTPVWCLLGERRALADLGERIVVGWFGGTVRFCFLEGSGVDELLVFSLSEYVAVKASLGRLVPRGRGRTVVMVVVLVDGIWELRVWVWVWAAVVVSSPCSPRVIWCGGAGRSVLVAVSICRYFANRLPMFIFRRLDGILLIRISIRVFRLWACNAYCALNFLARSVTSSCRLSMRACFWPAVIPIVGAARLEGEAIGVLAGDLVPDCSRRVDVAFEGDIFVFVARMGAIRNQSTTATRS